MEQVAKKPWQSKTLLLNGIGGLLAFVALFIPGAEGIQTFLTSHAAEVGMVWSLLNVVLRMITKDRVALGE